MKNMTKDQSKPRKGCIDVFNAFMLDGVELAGLFDIPVIQPTDILPQKLIAFSDVASGKIEPEPGTWIHFYEDDVKIERFWKNPKLYVNRLKGFEGFIAPDFSLYNDFTVSQQIWNTFRNYACGAWLQQSQRFKVIPNVRTTGWDSVPFTLAGVPHNSPIAIGSHGCLKNIDDRNRFTNDLKIVVDILHPSRILVYGTASYGAFNYPKELGIPIQVFPSKIKNRLGGNDEL